MYSFPNMDSKTEHRVFHAAVYSTPGLLVRLCLSYEHMSRRMVITGIKKVAFCFKVHFICEGKKTQIYNLSNF